ncbi:unnamed protein product [Mytilus edulis]|uniref:Tyr recombinase domain-containing protein n=1 Tax=Mytilus edulis TaxID=6550 RepID=A0A8S3QZS3_MYTED|nr:unnamed protein product [Mytilus edulis]
MHDRLWWHVQRTFFHVEFPDAIVNEQLHINALEMLTVVVCLKLWGTKLRGKRIIIKCDNQVTVTVINTGRSRNQFLQSCLREICFVAAINEFELRAVHIAGVDNRLADMLSRWHLHNEFSVKLLLKGIAREKQHLPKQALAITVDMLLDINRVINHDDPKQCTIWCLFLFAFFLMARKSNLVPDSKMSFDIDKQLTRNKVMLEGNIAIAIFYWSKTIQMGNRILKIPLIENTSSALCPLRAYRNMCKLIPAAGDSPAFLFPSKHKLVPVTYTDFQRYIKEFISKIGRNPRLFSTHSFRRGGATFAFESKVPAELIIVHGDWASDAYKLYLQFSLSEKVSVAKAMTKFIP